MPVKKKTVRNTPKLPKNVKINQKRKSQKKRGRRASRRGGGDGISDVEFNNEYKKPFREIEAFYNEYKGLSNSRLDRGKIAFSYAVYTENPRLKEPYILTHPFFQKLQEITRPDTDTNKSISNYLRACNNCFKNPSKYGVVFSRENRKDISNLINFVIQILEVAIHNMKEYIKECKKKSCSFNSFTSKIDYFLQTEGFERKYLISETDELGLTNYKIYTNIRLRYESY